MVKCSGETCRCEITHASAHQTATLGGGKHAEQSALPCRAAPRPRHDRPLATSWADGAPDLTLEEGTLSLTAAVLGYLQLQGHEQSRVRPKPCSSGLAAHVPYVQLSECPAVPEDLLAIVAAC